MQTIKPIKFFFDPIFLKVVLNKEFNYNSNKLITFNLLFNSPKKILTSNLLCPFHLLKISLSTIIMKV